MNSLEILQGQFLEMRARILELAASLDRIDRAEGDISKQPMIIKIRSGIEILGDAASDRAKRVQMLFSREYEQDWADTFTNAESTGQDSRH